VPSSGACPRPPRHRRRTMCCGADSGDGPKATLMPRSTQACNNPRGRARQGVAIGEGCGAGPRMACQRRIFITTTTVRCRYPGLW
jgi:hypothetical protein